MNTFIGTDIIARLLGDWSISVNTFSILFRIMCSVVFATVIGCERSEKRHAAGLRTFIFVSLASTVSMIIDISFFETHGMPICILSAASIIAISIISSNSILYSSRNQIKGLTTSAGLWASGILGFAAGAGYYTLLLIGFAAFMCILSLFPALEVYLKNRSNHFEIHLEMKDIKYLENFVTTIRKLGLTIDDIESNPAYAGSGLSVYSISLSINSEELKKYKTHKEIIEALPTLEYVSHVEEMN